MNRQPEATASARRIEQKRSGGWMETIFRQAKWIVVAVCLFLFASCAAPVVAGWWWFTSGDETPAATGKPIHPAQIVGTVAALITCADDEWVMSWSNSDGSKGYACVDRW